MNNLTTNSTNPTPNILQTWAMAKSDALAALEYARKSLSEAQQIVKRLTGQELGCSFYTNLGHIGPNFAGKNVVYTIKQGGYSIGGNDVTEHWNVNLKKLIAATTELKTFDTGWFIGEWEGFQK